LSRKNGASRKHHKIRQLQQIITAVRHHGKTKTWKISMFFLGGFLLRKLKARFKMKGNTRVEFCPTPPQLKGRLSPTVEKPTLYR
jgi:hypothetical protein